MTHGPYCYPWASRCPKACACDCHPTARLTDPETSHQAARNATPRAGTNRHVALQALKDAGSEGLTDFELAACTGIAQTSIGVRRHELVSHGLVVDSGQRRPAPSGSLAIVWRAA